MKFHAPQGSKHRYRLAAAAFAMTASLCPASAWALTVPAPPAQAVAEACPVAQPAAMVAAPLSKTEAILGGTRSKLEEMRAQQAAASAAALDQTAMLAPSAGPAAPIPAPCAVPLLAAMPVFAAQSQLQPAPMLSPVDVSKPDVFGSVALAIGRTPLDSKWKRAQAASIGGRGGPWRGLIGEARGLEQAGKIELVNRWVNARIGFADDSARFKVADRWATASETLRAGRGDCEDYAIAKMKLLEAAGVARGDMFLVIAKDLVRRADHALLVVRSGDRLVVLDNNTDRIVDAAAIQDYRPVMSYSAGKAWIHGYATAPETVPAPIRIAAIGG
ncbi:MAG: transglutaminase-like cysteine peptidase [Sphingorhabdus sp.]